MSERAEGTEYTRAASLERKMSHKFNEPFTTLTASPGTIQPAQRTLGMPVHNWQGECREAEAWNGTPVIHRID